MCSYFKHYKVYLVAFTGSKLLSQDQANSTDNDNANKENNTTDPNQENTEETQLDEETIKKNKEFEDKFSVELQSLQRIMEEKLETQKKQFLEQTNLMQKSIGFITHLSQYKRSDYSDTRL